MGGGWVLGELVFDVEVDLIVGYIKVWDYCKDGWIIIFFYFGVWNVNLVVRLYGSFR